MIRVRRATALAAVLLCTVAAAAPALAQEWPSGTVRVVLPVAAGGPLDLPARLLIDRLAAQTGGSFILEHRGGAGGSIAAQTVVQAAPDGGTLLFTTSSIAAAPAFYPKLGFDPRQALVPISLITEVPLSVMVRADHPIRDLADLIAKAKRSRASTRSAPAGSAPEIISPASCSRRWRASTCCMCRFAECRSG
jgi:tripartite-type tricarboxylate transporter receptor subunit TctC